MVKKILIIEDDPDLAEILRRRLNDRGFEVSTACNGREGLRVAYDKQPNLVILDIMMPEMNGIETCQRLRDLSDVPILMLTAMISEEFVVRGFQAGADDYIKKPFSICELEERINAVLKRAGMREPDTIVYDDGNIKIDLERQEVYRKGEMVHLTPTEAKLLSCLISRLGRVISHKELLMEVWGEAYKDATASLSLYIWYLREKLEEDPKKPVYIRSKWGVGYWFAPKKS